VHLYVSVFVTGCMLSNTFVRELEAMQREAAVTAAAPSQPDSESSEDSEESEPEQESPGILVQAYLRGSAASKSGLKPEVVPADEPLSDRVVVPPEGSALPEAGVYISSGKRVSVHSSFDEFYHLVFYTHSELIGAYLNFCHLPFRCATFCIGRTE
jgi:hypothetical protein